MHTFADQNTPHDTLPPPIQTPTCTYPSPPQLQQPTKKRLLSSCHTLRDPLILSVQPNSSFLCRLTLWFIAFCSVAVWTWILAGREEKNRNQSIITFYGFILLQQWPCHARMAHILCLVRGSACFMLMTQTSGWFCMVVEEYILDMEWPVCWKAQVTYSNSWIYMLTGECRDGGQRIKCTVAAVLFALNKICDLHWHESEQQDMTKTNERLNKELMANNTSACESREEKISRMKPHCEIIETQCLHFCSPVFPLVP